MSKDDPKYLYAVYEGRLVRAENTGGLSWPKYFKPDVPKFTTLRAITSDDENMTLEQFEKLLQPNDPSENPFHIMNNG